MHEYLVYSKADWLNGTVFGGHINEDDMLVNKFRELNNDEFINPITTNWQEDNILSQYTDLSYSDNNSICQLVVNKESDIDTISENKFCEISTDFFKNNIPATLKVMTLKFDWTAMETSLKEEAVIKLVGSSSSYQEIILNNKGSIKLHTFDGSQEFFDDVIDTAVDSIGDINNFIGNEMRDAYFDIRLVENALSGEYEIHTRLRGSGYISSWYAHNFANDLIKSLVITQRANENTNTIVKKDLFIDQILIEGYENNIVYKSDIIDSKENDTIWDKLELNGLFNSQQLHQTDDQNLFRVNIYAANSTENLQGNIRDLLINPNSGDFTYTDSLLAGEEQLTGRYLYFEVMPCTTISYQNKINYVKFEYTLQSELVQENIQVTSASVSDTLTPTGDVIEYNDTNFSFKLYLPPGAVPADQAVTIERIGEDEDIFAEGMIGFRFTPHTDLAKPALLEVDYTGYSFGPYMSEKGLLLGYIDANSQPEQLNTVKDYKHKKALAYIYSL